MSQRKVAHLISNMTLNRIGHFSIFQFCDPFFSLLAPHWASECVRCAEESESVSSPAVGIRGAVVVKCLAASPSPSLVRMGSGESGLRGTDGLSLGPGAQSG